MSDVSDTLASSEAALEAEIQAEVERRVASALAKAEAARVEQEKALGYVSPVVPDPSRENSLPGWYPVPEPIEEDQERRVFPRGTDVTEVIEYDRMQALKRAEKNGGAPKPLPQGTVTASAAEFLAAQR